MPHIDIRPARPEDREVVLAFCSNTWEWGDYIERVWDEWLSDPAGLLLVATVDEQPAGVAHMDMLTAEDAWLEGLRVDPQFRHQGLARALTEALQLEAMRRGATRARLAVESTNERSIQISERGHWYRVGEFTLFSATDSTGTPQPSAEGRSRLATLADLESIIGFLNASNSFPLVGGLYYIRFKAYPISEVLLRDKIAAGGIYILQRWERLDGLMILEEREEQGRRQLSVGYVDGTAIESVSLLAYDLRYRAHTLGVKSIRIYAPDLVLVHDAFTGVGYEGGEATFYTYERGLT
jgi:GNAT superfamily N-acetyltransferase